jgi:hypothetical protein
MFAHPSEGKLTDTLKLAGGGWGVPCALVKETDWVPLEVV